MGGLCREGHTGDSSVASYPAFPHPRFVIKAQGGVERLGTRLVLWPRIKFKSTKMSVSGDGDRDGECPSFDSDTNCVSMPFSTYNKYMYIHSCGMSPTAIVRTCSI